mmetsp:Transcript_8898/g.23652  ORF Transcript_8898/g.23652 Transcript_8898/m.23652 type:complete len:205 (+) Transcript_8898:768-1382(+)
MRPIQDALADEVDEEMHRRHAPQEAIAAQHPPDGLLAGRVVALHRRAGLARLLGGPAAGAGEAAVLLSGGQAALLRRVRHGQPAICAHRDGDQPGHDHPQPPAVGGRQAPGEQRDGEAADVVRGVPAAPPLAPALCRVPVHQHLVAGRRAAALEQAVQHPKRSEPGHAVAHREADVHQPREHQPQGEDDDRRAKYVGQHPGHEL